MPASSDTLRAQTLLDVRVSKVVPFGESKRLELIFDVLNLFNEAAPEDNFSLNFFSPNFHRPGAWVRPRQAMFGLKLVF